jgi:phosphoribosylaminoimidazole-succinocarboxamide synthase
MSKPLTETHFNFPGQTDLYKGKVRDVYSIDSDVLVMVASDRISAFDVVLPKGIPFKGQVLNQLAAFFLRAVEDIVPHWLIDCPLPNVSVGYRCDPFKVEMVVRGYLAGHAARQYALGHRTICGVKLPDGLRENDPLPKPIITPTTKAAVGHDEDISKSEIIARGLVSEHDYQEIERYSLSLYQRGQHMANSRGLILVDTKYEFGKRNNRIYLMDEIHTPDSSRYFYAEGYEALQNKAMPQRQLSKEFVRQWLIQNGFQGKTGQTIPEMTDAWTEVISKRYIELYEAITGLHFIPESYTPDEIAEGISNWLKTKKPTLV